MQISVSGEQRVQVPPERAVLGLAATREGTDRAAVLRAVTDAAARLTEELAALQDSGTVERFSVQPLRTYAWKPNRSTERTAATVDVSATFVDFEELGRFTAALGGRDAVRLGGVSWTLTDATADRLRDECIEGAVARATQRATAMAKAAGAGDVEIVEIADPGMLDESQVPVRTAMMGAYKTRDGLPEAEAFEVIPEDIQIGVQLHLRFVTA